MSMSRTDLELLGDISNALEGLLKLMQLNWEKLSALEHAQNEMKVLLDRRDRVLSYSDELELLNDSDG